MSRSRPTIVVVAAQYKYGTYVTDEALALLDAVGERRQVDLRAVEPARRYRTFAGLAADADAVVVAPWGGQGLETIPGWLDAVPRAGVVAGTFDYRFESVSGVDVFRSGRRITVVDTSRTLAPTVAEFCLAMVLNLLRDIPHEIDVVRTGGWTQEWRDIDGFVGGDLAGRAVGLAGFGVINQTLDRLLRPFGCAVSAFDPHVAPSVMGAAGVTATGSLVELARGSEIFVVGIPELPDTVEVVSREVIDALPAGALFVLPTRMAVVAQDALWDRVAAGQLRAAVDVYAPEPPPPDAWFRGHRHVLPTPHMAGNTAQGHRRCFQLACADTAAALTGRPVRHAMTQRDADIYGGRLPATVDVRRRNGSGALTRKSRLARGVGHLSGG
jgi:phosphoglycerate dehydrogenase-like enzyme